MKPDGFQDQGIEFQFKCMVILKKKKTHKISCWKIDQETFCVFFFHLRKLQKLALKLYKILYTQAETTLYRFLKNALVLFWL